MDQHVCVFCILNCNLLTTVLMHKLTETSKNVTISFAKSQHESLQNAKYIIKFEPLLQKYDSQGLAAALPLVRRLVT